MKMDLQKESFISKRADDEKKRNNEIASVFTLSCSNPLLWLIGKYFFFPPLYARVFLKSETIDPKRG